MALGLSYVQYFCLFTRWIFVRLVPGFIVCLVSSCRYNGLATLALAGPSGPRAGASRPLWALRASTRGVLGSTSIGSKAQCA